MQTIIARDHPGAEPGGDRDQDKGRKRRSKVNFERRFVFRLLVIPTWRQRLLDRTNLAS